MKIELWVRNIIYWLALSCVTPMFFMGLLLAAPLPRRTRHIVGVKWAMTLLWLLENVVGLRYKVIGQENIPNVPSIICSKHQSGWETLALQKVFPFQIYVAKRELLWIPFFGWGLAIMNPITINRSNKIQANQKMQEQGLARKKLGFWITVFPEGTRTKPGAKVRYKLGAARMSQNLDMPLVPVAHNAGEFWPRNSFLKYPGEITMSIGPAVYPSEDSTPDVLMQTCQNWIETQQDQIGGAGPCYAKIKAYN